MIMKAPHPQPPHLTPARPVCFVLALAIALTVCGCGVRVRTAGRTGGSSTSTTMLGVRIKATRTGARSVSSSSTSDNVKATLKTTIDGVTQTLALEVSDPDTPDSPRKLTIDGKSYGTVKPGDEVLLSGNSVAINGRDTAPAQLAEAE